MDQADQAQAYIELELQSKIDAAKNNEVEESKDCVECGIEIPKKRREIIKTNLCVHCSEINSLKAKHYR